MLDNTFVLSSKKNLMLLADSLNVRLEKYWNSELEKNFGSEKTQRNLVKKILLHAMEHNLRSAKRVRASFVYYGYLLGKKELNEGVWKVMEAVELIQTALLMHDDFMDEDLLRRGLPTTQEYFSEGDKHYGEAMAVNIGDVVLCLGYERILSCGLENDKIVEATKILMRGIVNTALGQAYDVTLPKLGELTEEKILAIHREKTSIYTFQNPLLIGAVLAGLDEKAQEILKQYSQKAGVAFQLQDDILGMFGESSKTGKSVNSDLFQRKSTLLVVKTLEKGTERQRTDLLAAWGNKNSTEIETKMAKKAIKESGAYQYSVNKAKGLASESINIVEKLKEFDLDAEAIKYLVGIAQYIVTRDV